MFCSRLSSMHHAENWKPFAMLDWQCASPFSSGCGHDNGPQHGPHLEGRTSTVSAFPFCSPQTSSSLNRRLSVSGNLILFFSWRFKNAATIPLHFLPIIFLKRSSSCFTRIIFLLVTGIFISDGFCHSSPATPQTFQDGYIFNLAV